MTDRHAEGLASLSSGCGPALGSSRHRPRAAAIDGDPLPDPLAQGYVETIRVGQVARLGHEITLRKERPSG
jgi:hypothetical protein